MGGLEAVRSFLRGLPGDLPSTLFVVIHTATSDAELFARAIGGVSPWPVTVAREGEGFAPGQVYVPPADHHLLVGRVPGSGL